MTELLRNISPNQFREGDIIEGHDVGGGKPVPMGWGHILIKRELIATGAQAEQYRSFEVEAPFGGKLRMDFPIQGLYAVRGVPR